MTSRIGFSLILACYNEGPTFEKSVRQIVSELKKINLKWEVIFVEDKSTDNTKQSIEKLLSEISGSRAIFHRRNEGRGKSVTDGMLAGLGKICGYMDVDCEISPGYISVFIEEIKKGSDMAIATRFYESTPNSAVREVASKAYSLIVSKLLGVSFKDTESGYKFFNREKIIPVLKKTIDKRWFWDTEICIRANAAGLKVSEIPVLFIRRGDKKSTVKLFPDSIEYLKRVLEFRIKHRKELLS